MKTEELELGSTVGVSPSGMCEKPYMTGTVSKITKTQLTVKYLNGKTDRFVRDTGREYGGDTWHPARLVSLDKVKEANAVIIPRLHKKKTWLKLREIVDRCKFNKYTQKQIDTALNALSEQEENHE